MCPSTNHSESHPWFWHNSNIKIYIFIQLDYRILNSNWTPIYPYYIAPMFYYDLIFWPIFAKNNSYPIIKRSNSFTTPIFWAKGGMIICYLKTLQKILVFPLEIVSSPDDVIWLLIFQFVRYFCVNTKHNFINIHFKGLLLDNSNQYQFHS